MWGESSREDEVKQRRINSNKLFNLERIDILSIRDPDFKQYKNNWIETMEHHIQRRNDFLGLELGKQGNKDNKNWLGEALYFFGLGLFINECFTEAEDEFKKCEQYKRGRWYLSVLNPEKLNKLKTLNWLELFVKCEVISYLLNLETKWNEFSTPMASDIFNCFNIDISQVKGIVFGMSPLNYNEKSIYASNGFAFGVKPKGSEFDFDKLPRSVRNIFIAIDSNGNYKPSEKKLIKKFLAEIGFNIEKFSRETGYLFYNTRLAYCINPEDNHGSSYDNEYEQNYKKAQENKARDISEEFTSSVVDELLNNNPKIKIFSLFYSPCKNKLDYNPLKDVLEKHKEKNNIEIFEVNYVEKPHENSVGKYHIGWYSEAKIEQLAKDLSAHPEFQDLLQNLNF